MTDPEAETAAGGVFDTASPREICEKNPPNRGGRPPHRPTEETRRTVETSAATLFSHAAIAPLVGLGSVNTLKKHYSEELALGGAKACLKVSEKLQRLVEAGNERVILFLAKAVLGLN